MTEPMILLVFNSLAHVAVLRALNLWTLWGNFSVYVNLDFSMIFELHGCNDHRVRLLRVVLIR